MSSALAEHREKQEGLSEGVISIVMSETGTVKSFSGVSGTASSTYWPILFADSEVVVVGLEVGLGAADYCIFRLLPDVSEPSRIRRICR